MAERHYTSRGWTCDTPTGISNASFSASSTEIHVQVAEDGCDIGNGWRLLPESNPEVSSKTLQLTTTMMFHSLWKKNCTNKQTMHSAYSLAKPQLAT